jgi:BirA family biotin operon repressor/biotin-[acetyl-CoA-carboxylase] ligase
MQPCLLVAEEQTSGRGRLGREWRSQAGASLTFSLALPLAPADWSGLSLAVGLALAEALDPQPASATPRIGLKWPNDLWLVDAPAAGGRKLGGVLIETVASGGLRIAVIGIGLNLQPRPGQEPDPGLSSGYAGLHELDPAITAPAALAAVAAPLLRALLRFESEGFAPFMPAWARRDLLCGRPVSTTAADWPEGESEGVDAQGALLLRTGGRLHRVVSGEVSVRPQPPVTMAASEARPC